MQPLQTCPSCSRHIKVDEAACPFCGAPTPEGFASTARRPVPFSAPLSRAAILFLGAASACGSSSPKYGPAFVYDYDSGPERDAFADSSARDARVDSAVPDSGLPDSGEVGDGPASLDSGLDSGTLAMYGPAVVDSGTTDGDAEG